MLTVLDFSNTNAEETAYSIVLHVNPILLYGSFYTQKSVFSPVLNRQPQHNYTARYLGKQFKHGVALLCG